MKEMSKTKTALTLAERQAIRLVCFEYIEYTLAKYMAENSLMRLFEQNLTLDAGNFPYIQSSYFSFRKTVSFKILFCELTAAGIALRERAQNNPDRAPTIGHYTDPLISSNCGRIIFTPQGALKMIEKGQGALLVALNSGLISSEYCSYLSSRSELAFFDKQMQI